MIFVKPDPAGDSIGLSQAEAVSAKLATDIAAGVERYAAEPARWPWSPSTIRTALSRLMPALKEVVTLMPNELRVDFCRRGLCAISDEVTWANLIGVIYQCCEEQLQRGPVIGAFEKMIAFHRNDPATKPPCHLVVRGGHSDLSELYRVSPTFLLSYKRLIQQFDAGGKVNMSGLTLKHQTYSQLSLILADPQARTWLTDEGFDAFAAHPELIALAEKHRTWQLPSSMTTLLACHDPIRWMRKTVDMLGYSSDLTDLYALSEPVYRDIERFAKYMAANPLKGREAKTMRDLLTNIQRDLPVILAELPETDAASITSKGLVAFTENGCRLLSAMLQLDSLKTGQVTRIKDAVDTLFPDAKRDIKDLLPFQFAFESDYSDRPLYCDFAPVRAMSIHLYDDLERLLGELKASLREKNFNMTTVYHHYTQLKAVLMLFRTEIEQQFGTELCEHGMGAFDLPGHKLQKTLFALLQGVARSDTVKTITAYTYKRSVAWFLTQFGFTVVEAYPITISRTEKHLKRLNTDDYYSAEQCRELAFHVENLLTDPAMQGEYRIALLLARILLKTGWNLSPTLAIECDDIVRTATPLNPNGTVAVVLRKARAGYRTDAYTFSDPTTNISAMRSAVADLLHIRDELTTGLRASLSANNPYRSFIFLIERKGVPQRLPMAATRTVTELLAKQGCALTFDSKKIRKGGVNHLYRQVQKDLRDYESAAKHDFRTFESSYYRIDENQSRYTLGKAVDVMGKYFTGKEIGTEIVIVTDPIVALQHTPAGECASLGEDSEAERYGVEHKRLHAERGAGVRYCADFLSCIWCKFFRLVADPEHVWKLLSYREYLLRAMEASVLDGDATEDQQAHIDILKARIADILKRLEELTPGVIQKGESLQSTRGMHPDWSFALADAPLR